MQKVVEGFSNKLEDLIFEAFRYRGFPKHWILSNAKRVHVRYTINNLYCEEAIYGIDDCDLFKVKITSNYDDDRFHIHYDVKIESCKKKENENAQVLY